MDILGFPLDRAMTVLEKAGKPVRLIEVSSKTGSKGHDARVIKVDASGPETIVYWARFRTTIEEQDGKVQG